MANLVRCDECGREARDEDDAPNWLRVERYGVEFLWSSDPTPSLPWHFCGIPHLAAFAAKHDHTKPRQTNEPAPVDAQRYYGDEPVTLTKK